MRVRRQVVIRRGSGDTTSLTELLGDAGFAQRARELRESVPGDTGPVQARSLSLACDGCGVVAVLDWDRPELPAGWTERADGDFCPAC